MSHGQDGVKSVLVTGASRGIGLATAQAFAARGDRVVLAARSAGELDRARDAIRADGGHAWSWSGDLTQPDACRSLAAHARETVGPLDVAVLSAGIGHWGAVADMTQQQWRETMAINLDAVFSTTQAILDDMLDRGRGHLVFVSSVLGRKGVPNMSAYCASKAAVAAFAESLGAEVKPHGLKVTVMYPGTTATTMREHQSARPRTPDITDPDLQLAPEDVANAIVWATDASDRAFPTGVTIEPRGIAGGPPARTAR